MEKVLFASSEVFPLIKTGGLGDVAGSLPLALDREGHDVRILLPAYGDVLAKTKSHETVAKIALNGLPGTVDILEAPFDNNRIKLWLVHYGPAFDRKGNPYLAPDGAEWPDNAARFALFSRIIARIGQGTAGLDWVPSIVHCNDWQTGLAPALLAMQYPRPATVFTIHNLAYQGVFPYATFHALGLPPHLWSPGGIEYFGNVAFIKGGLVYADMITTVSPNYAQEIQTPRFGHGMDGLLRHRNDRLTGILNGIDLDQWNPETDPYLEKHYNFQRIAGKNANKSALQQDFSLAVDDDIPLIGLVGRLVQQKGIDLVIGALPKLIALGYQIIFLGTGEKGFETALSQWAQRYPQEIAVRIGYDEGLAHRIEAGVDMFLMPSRFEPCGLNQMYSQRYGTVPIVHNVGGLADTVVDATPQNLRRKQATGLVFFEEQISDLELALDRAYLLFQDKKQWRALQRAGMSRDFSWQASAQHYTAAYQQALSYVG